MKYTERGIEQLNLIRQDIVEVKAGLEELKKKLEEDIKFIKKELEGEK